MAPFEALYDRRCRTPLNWSQIGERKVLGPDLVSEAEEKIRIIQANLKTAQSRQKSYADVRRKPLQFQVGDFVYLRVSPTRGVQRFGIKGKLAPRYIGPFEVLEACGPVAYRLQLPPQLATVNNIFNVSQLKKCVKIPTEIIESQAIEIEPDLTYIEHPMRILDIKERSTRRKPSKCTRFNGTIIRKKKQHGKPNPIFSITSPTSSKPTSELNHSIPFYSGISGRDSF
jgi:hypothetical protein